MTSDSKKTFIATRTLLQGGKTARRMRTYRLRVTGPEGPAFEQSVDEPVLRAGSRNENQLVLADDAVSRLHFQIEADEDGYRLRDLGSTNGTFVDGYRARDLYLRPGAVIQVGGTEINFEPLRDEKDVPAAATERFGPLVGASIKMRELFATLAKVAPTNATVLVEGETGTGKELVARAIHEHSTRSGGPLAVFDCASVASNLLESEIFGHEKGAFTGASDRRIGRMEEADGGTLFIDELGELPLDLQPKLLRALERREVRRVGGRQTFPVDIRIVAATNRDLAHEVNRGSFREDLYYRLAVVRVHLPSVRERRSDIPLLVQHFIRSALRDDPTRADKTLGSIREANWQKLKNHPWPGNVRELKNVIERTLALSGGDTITGIEAPVAPRSASAATGEAPPPSVDLDKPFVDLKAATVARFEEAYLKGQLERQGGNISRAAAASGIDRMYFKRLLKKYP